MSDYKVGKVLITQEEILKKAEGIGKKVTEEFKGESLVVVGILRGAVPWLADVIKYIDLDMEVDFMACSSYGSEKMTSGQVKITKDLDSDIDGKSVLIVEDIVDSGTTLEYLKKYFANRNAKRVKICALLDKPAGRKVDIDADYVGFEVDDVFLVGYGLDYAQKYRQLPYVSYLEEEESEAAE